MKAFFFDLDGTLANTVPLNIECFQVVFREFGNLFYSYTDVKDLFGPNEKGLIKKVIGDRWPEGFEMYLHEYKDRHAKYDVPFPGVLELLEDLRRKEIRLAVVTGKGEETTRFSLACLGLEKFFEEILTGDLEGNVKPARIRKLLSDWELSPSEVAYVGDSPQDMEDADQCGLLALGAGWDSDADVLKKKSPMKELCFSPQEVLAFISQT